MPQAEYGHANWPAAGEKSKAVALSGNTLCGFITPSDLTGTAITFEMAEKIDGTYVPVKDSGGSAISFTVAASGYYGFKQDQIAAFIGVRFVKVVSGSSEAAGRQVLLALREVAG